MEKINWQDSHGDAPGHDEKNYGAEEWRAPETEAGDTILFSECGRVLFNVDYRSHYFRVVKDEYGGIALLVKHGNGLERIREHFMRKIVSALQVLSSDDRYMTLYTLWQAHYVGRKQATDETAAQYRAAFAEGRLKKRKVRNSATFRVWIEPKKATMGVI